MKTLFDYEHMFLVVFGGMSFVLVGYVLWIGLHPFVCRRFDRDLFKAPYFRPNELFLYASWPFNLFRSLAYILLLTMPWAARKRRFKGVEIDTSGDRVLTFFARLMVLASVIGIFFTVILFIWGGFLYMENPSAWKW